MNEVDPNTIYKFTFMGKLELTSEGLMYYPAVEPQAHERGLRPVLLKNTNPDDLFFAMHNRGWKGKWLSRDEWRDLLLILFENPCITDGIKCPILRRTARLIHDLYLADRFYSRPDIGQHMFETIRALNRVAKTARKKEEATHAKR